MKKNLLHITIILCFAANAFSQNTFPSTGATGIGTASPNGKSILEIKSTTKGVLLPRMTKTQRDAITAPPDGLIIYQTDNNAGIYYYQGAWKAANNVRGLNNNLFIGQNAGNSTTTATSNIALGRAALKNNTDRAMLIAIGDSTLMNNAVGVSQTYYSVGNVAIGHCVLQNNLAGYNNTGIGFEVLKLTTDGHENTGVGHRALYDNTYGSSNCAFGVSSLTNNTLGSYNTCYGYRSMIYNTTGNYNTALGNSAMANNISGTRNTAAGLNSLSYNTYGNYNAGFGYGTLDYTTSSEYNTAIGYNAGNFYNHGYNNVFVGSNTNTNGAGYYNVIAIGQGTVCTNVSQARFGNSSTTSYGGYADWTDISDGRYKSGIQENVPGLTFINKLKPITYHLEAGKLDAFLHKNTPPENQLSGAAKSIHEKALKEKEQITYTGFIAQDVEAAAKELDFDFSGVDAAKNENDVYGLRYAKFTVPLVKAVQELSAKNEKLEQQVAALESLIRQQGDANKSAVNNEQLATGNSQLFQNQPNPFNKTTVINYQLKSGDANAKIIIRDLNGNLVKQVNLSQTGKGQVTINANELAQGTYTYTLEVNGTSVDTKLMVLVK
ncbi:MAG: T9SS type A sorting domain-containing protein [Bacteroidia bacterium]